MLSEERFHHVISGAILLNAAVFAWGLIDHAHAEIAEDIEHLIVAFFVLELVIRVRAVGWQLGVFVRSPWNAFDLAVIALALLPVLPVGLTLLRLARLARVVHLMRHVSQLRMVEFLKGRVAQAH